MNTRYLFLALLILSCLRSIASEDQKHTIDGDTFKANVSNIYRLAGIDAPEHDQPFGDQLQGLMS